jgi:hypothetical protein
MEKRIVKRGRILLPPLFSSRNTSLTIKGLPLESSFLSKSSSDISSSLAKGDRNESFLEII